jgi:transcriptional regulator with PAS, ATPase and Fis domain
MSPILFIAPDTELFATAKRLQKKMFPDIKVVQGFVGEGVRLAARHSRAGTEIFITRGRTASLLREAALPGVVVDVPFTAFDYLRAINQARTMGERAGAVIFPEMAPPVWILKELLPLDIEIALIESEADAVAALDAALSGGADVIVGGMAARKAAQERKVPFVPLRNGDEAVIQAFQEARRMEAMRTIEKTKAHVLQTVVEHASEGVIITDAALQIRQFSPPAAGRFIHAGKSAEGRCLGDVWPELAGKKAFPRSDVVMGERLLCNGVECLCNRVVIRVAGAVTGLVVIFQELDALRVFASAPAGNAAGNSGERTAEGTFSMVKGDSAPLRAAINEAKEYALTESPICITGETGTGKSLFAESIHNYSRRMSGPFVPISCGLLSPRRLERCISGKPGPDRDEDEPGIFDDARGGTVYLDEIGDLDPGVQTLLAGILQQRKGLTTAAASPLNIRIIAGTRHNIPKMIQDGRFNANLYYLLNVLQVSLPSLDERREDIPVLARHFLHLAAEHRNMPLSLDEDAVMLLYRYSWSGNVRELANITERIAAASHGGNISRKLVRAILDKNRPHSTTAFKQLIRDDAVERIRDALRESKGRHHLAAARLGIDRSTLWRRMKKYGMK